MKHESSLNIEDIAAGQNIKEKEYWINRMSGYTGKAIFPYDRQPIQSKNEEKKTLETVTFDIAGEVYEKLMVMINNSDPRLHMLLVTALTVLLARYSGKQDIIIGTPIYNPDIGGKFINTILPLRNWLPPGISFKNLLLQVRETIVQAAAHQNYPVKTLVYQLGMNYSETDFPLFDIVLLLENIQDKKYIQPLQPNIIFAFRREQTRLRVNLRYNGQLYWKTTIERIIRHIDNLFRQTVFNVNLPLNRIQLLSEEEKKQVLYDFNDTGADFPAHKTLHELFTEQVERTPENIAVSWDIDLDDIFADLKSGQINHLMNQDYENCCFKKNPYIFTYRTNTFLETLDIVNREEIQQLLLLKTHKQNYVILHHLLFLLLDYFDGETNLKAIFNGIIDTGQTVTCMIYNLERREEAELFTARKSEFTINNDFENFVWLIKTLYMSSLIHLVDYRSSPRPVEIQLDKKKSETLKSDPDDTYDAWEQLKEIDSPPHPAKHPKSPVLVLGDTPGVGSTGILYLTSFLRRNGIEAYCQWTDLILKTAQLKEAVITLLDKVRPKLVGISMKWFLHMARVLEICKIIKEYNPGIEVVLGGNTASYYSENFIQYECIDYVILGDGEIPLLKICMGEEDLRNCLYKKEGKIIKTSTIYVQNEANSSHIYLSHLEDIFVSPGDCYLPDYFYITAAKGCPMMCIYCAGCRTAQKQTFNRSKPFLRGLKEVQSDIRTAKKYTSTLMFDFDSPLYTSLEHYKRIWEGIDLSNHFCLFYLLKLPGIELIDLVSRTFKYVTFDIDIASLSMEHRKKLDSPGLVKPQPTDEELLLFLDHCESYDNVNAQITMIAGLPYISPEDIEESYDFLERLLKKSRFNGIVWRRLHAQPGAPITSTSETYNMHSYATTFEDFLHYSQLNLKEERYPHLDDAHYPYVYSKNEELNSKISELYMKTTRRIRQNNEEKKEKLTVTFTATYNELNQKANRLAHVLRKKGVKPDTIVGLSMDRSIEMIVGILGVLKAGGAYLPLDLEYPENRRAYMLEESGASWLVVPTKTWSPIDFKGEVIVIHSDPVDRQPVNNPGNVNKPRDLAYVIYTSGSTGKSKGVLIEHHNVVAYTCSSRELIDLTSADIRLQQSSFSFDQFVEEVYPLLSVGGKLILLKKSDVRDPEKLSTLMEQNKVTVFSTTPAVLREVDKYPLAKSLRRILVGGDVLTVKDIANIVKKMPVDNFYGPTETTAAAAHYHYTGNRGAGVIPIGKPKTNYQLYILDNERKAVPIGVIGEIYISGQGVARGYLNRPELTAEKFLEIEETEDFNRLHRSYRSHRSYNTYLSYRTGDLGRWLPEGNIEFAGRIDYQVKIRGFRIELGEIENLLNKHENVKEAVVIETRNNQLCAYIVPNSADPSRPASPAQLVEYLASQLPDYMIPLYFMPLEKIPITPNGKLDRDALPEPKFEEEVEYVPPGNEIERKMVDIWGEILEIENNTIGIDANFFELGGHSLKATIMAAKIHKVFDRKLSLAEIFKIPTIRGIASLISAIEWADKKELKTNTRQKREEIVL